MSYNTALQSNNADLQAILEAVNALPDAKIPDNYAELNYCIADGLDKPLSPVTNTIWVDTDIAISESVFSATEPTSPAEGMVWFNISNVCNTPINAIKKSSLMVYPISCQQYVGGVWVTKEAKVYQNEEWRDVRTLSIWLFNNGDLGESGGFQKTAGTLTVSTEIYLKIMSGTPAYVTTENQIDLASFSTVTFVCKGAGVTTANFYVGVGTTRNGFAAETKANYTDYTEVTVDVSNLTGLHYVGFRNASYSTSNTSESYVKSIMLS